MSILNVISLLGGLALFLYGIALMGDGLGKVAGSKLQVILYRVSGNPLKGILLGIAVTALIQSSSTTSVMAIGFVNSGLMAFSQAVSIILGSIVGTSITGWIVSLSAIGSGGWTTIITGGLATVGVILLKFSKNPTHNHVGTILLGFAVLMFGMTAMSNAVSPLRESESFIGLLAKLSNPLLGILAGMVFTAILRSSAAAVGILQALSMTDVLTFSTAFPILLGIAVGGALPVLISALDASLNARRTALVHLIVNVCGAVFCGVVFYVVNAVCPLPFMDANMTPVSVAALNTVFRIITVAVMVPAIGLLEKTACFFMKDEPADDTPEGDWVLLEDRFIQHPALALEQCRIALASMAEKVRENIYDALALLRDYTDEGFRHVQDTEEIVDRYEDTLGTYIVKVTASELTEKQNEDVYQFLHAITDLERISDHASNIAENAKEIHEKSISTEGVVGHEMDVMEGAITEVLDTALRALTESDLDAAYHVEPLEELIDNLCDDMKRRHIDRLTKGVYTRQNSFVFNDLITNYERVSDHCSNIAVAMIELSHEVLDMHDYIEDLMSRKDEMFERYYREYREKYSFD